MNKTPDHNNIGQRMFDFNIYSFPERAIELYQFQMAHNPVYRQFAELTSPYNRTPANIAEIPFLPISFFKTHQITTTRFEPALVFESSGTTQTANSRHFIKDSSIYTESFTRAFELFYGKPDQYCILGLLPSYLERQHSSLVLMADTLIKKSRHPRSGFYLHNHAQLANTLRMLEQEGQSTLLIGVTFALLDFAMAYPMPLKHTIIMETGGMKGRRKELVREEVHTLLKNAFNIPAVHSEYGMTELLSQAYAKKDGRYYCPPWMKVVLRSEDDPFDIIKEVSAPATGIINVIDLANIYSAAFIATGDAGRLYPDGSFEVLGRVDHSDIRGCSLMVV